jgi:probable phosphoglycerate mutase
MEHVQQEQKQRDSDVHQQSKTTRLVIVRHGQTPWNKEGRIQGQTDIALNDKGFMQAAALAQVLQRLGITENVDAIVSSDLQRARQTADVIAALCPQAQRRIDPDIGEINFGELQGSLFKEREDLMNGVYNAWRSGDFQKSFPGAKGESLAHVMDRGLGAFHRAADLGSTVVVVTHLNFLKWSAVGIELGNAEPSPSSAESMQGSRIKAVSDLAMSAIPNCCVSNLVYDHESNSFRPEVWFQPLSNPLNPDDTCVTCDAPTVPLDREQSLEVPQDKVKAS